METLRRRLVDTARDLGFARAGFTRAAPFERGGAALSAWLADDHHGSMHYMASPNRSDPRVVQAEAGTIMVVASAYGGETGAIARYARGEDYHVVLREKLAELATVAGNVACRPCVDTAPLLEREAAMRAGVAFIGKSTMAIVPGAGSYVLLGELLLDVDLPSDEPLKPRCGRCRLCLDACPTGAFVSPFVLDARRCISYLTIEHKGAIPRELRARIGTRVFGCDVCQEVCPYNRTRKPRALEPRLEAQSALQQPDLVALLELKSGNYRRLVRTSALGRTSRNQLARNAAVALGNAGDPEAIPALSAAAHGHISPVVRGHALWALGRLGARDAIEPGLRGDDESVRDEARAALQPIDRT